MTDHECELFAGWRLVGRGWLCFGCGQTFDREHTTCPECGGPVMKHMTWESPPLKAQEPK